MSIISCAILFYNKKRPVLQKPRKQAFLLFYIIISSSTVRQPNKVFLTCRDRSHGRRQCGK